VSVYRQGCPRIRALCLFLYYAARTNRWPVISSNITSCFSHGLWITPKQLWVRQALICTSPFNTELCPTFFAPPPVQQTSPSRHTPGQEPTLVHRAGMTCTCALSRSNPSSKFSKLVGTTCYAYLIRSAKTAGTEYPRSMVRLRRGTGQIQIGVTHQPSTVCMLPALSRCRRHN
jgi:hypothetical protein